MWALLLYLHLIWLCNKHSKKLQKYNVSIICYVQVVHALHVHPTFICSLFMTSNMTWTCGLNVVTSAPLVLRAFVNFSISLRVFFFLLVFPICSCNTSTSDLHNVVQCVMVFMIKLCYIVFCRRLLNGYFSLPVEFRVDCITLVM